MVVPLMLPIAKNATRLWQFRPIDRCRALLHSTSPFGIRTRIMIRFKVLHLCVAAVAIISSHAAQAGDRKARLTIDVQVTGDETWRGTGSDQAKVKFSQHLSLLTFVRADGDPMDSNPKDPNYGEQQMRKAAKVSQAARARAQRKRRSKPKRRCRLT